MSSCMETFPRHPVAHRGTQDRPANQGPVGPAPVRAARSSGDGVSHGCASRTCKRHFSTEHHATRPQSGHLKRFWLKALEAGLWVGPRGHSPLAEESGSLCVEVDPASYWYDIDKRIIAQRRACGETTKPRRSRHRRAVSQRD
jgi:hypothetical protein